MTIPDRGGLQAVGSLDIVGHFSPCTPVELNLITKVLSDYNELKLWFLSWKYECKCDRRLLTC